MSPFRELFFGAYFWIAMYTPPVLAWQYFAADNHLSLLEKLILGALFLVPAGMVGFLQDFYSSRPKKNLSYDDDS
jgi:hypothetical protein